MYILPHKKRLGYSLIFTLWMNRISSRASVESPLLWLVCSVSEAGENLLLSLCEGSQTPLVRFPAAEGMGIIVTCGDTVVSVPSSLQHLAPLYFLETWFCLCHQAQPVPSSEIGSRWLPALWHPPWDSWGTGGMRSRPGTYIVPRHQDMKLAYPVKVPLTSWRPVFADLSGSRDAFASKNGVLYMTFAFWLIPVVKSCCPAELWTISFSC